MTRSGFEEDDLEMLLPAIARYLINNPIRGWLFQANVAGKPMAYLVTRLDYTPSGEEETGRVTLELKANAKGKVAISTVTIRARDIAEKTITEIFMAKGFLKETPELISSYDDAAGHYFEWCGQSGAQFCGKGTGFLCGRPNRVASQYRLGAQGCCGFINRRWHGATGMRLKAFSVTVP